MSSGESRFARYSHPGRTQIHTAASNKFSFRCGMIFATNLLTLLMKFNAPYIATIFSFVFTSGAHAISSEELMSQAIRTGQASGVLTGATADRMKSVTHSTGETLGSVVRTSIDQDHCHFYHFTVTQTKIPTTSGKLVGDYVVVSRSKHCPDDRKQDPPAVIDCHIAGVSCMPPRAR